MKNNSRSRSIDFHLKLPQEGVHSVWLWSQEQRILWLADRWHPDWIETALLTAAGRQPVMKEGIHAFASTSGLPASLIGFRKPDSLRSSSRKPERRALDRDRRSVILNETWIFPGLDYFGRHGRVCRRLKPSHPRPPVRALRLIGRGG